MLSYTPPTAKKEAKQILSLLQSGAKSNKLIAIASLATSLIALFLSGAAVFYASKDARDDDKWRTEQLAALKALETRMVANTNELSKLTRNRPQLKDPKQNPLDK